MADLSTLETIKASDKPTENDFSYIYAESANKAFIRIAKEELKKLILDGEYTNEEIDQKISTIPKFTTKVVSSLPTTDISETTVYLVSSGDDSENLYTEYININGLWEILGTQKSTFSGSAKDVTYDDTETKLGADNVQDAVGKLQATVNDKLDSSKLPEAVNTALAQAKASGEFNGQDGYTPQKGRDYFTESDKQEIVNKIFSQVTNGNEVAY